MKKSTLLVFLLGVVPSFVFAFSFDHSLSVGSRGDDVTALQKILIQQGYLSGASTGYFGLLTKNAVATFQKAHGLPSVGIVGKATRSFLNSSTSTINVTTHNNVVTVKPRVFTRSLYVGSTGRDVAVLQSFLKSIGFYTASSTTRFDSNTARAVSAFQKANNLEPTGFFGPQTRALINAFLVSPPSTIASSGNTDRDNTTSSAGSSGAGVVTSLAPKVAIPSYGSTDDAKNKYSSGISNNPAPTFTFSSTPSSSGGGGGASGGGGGGGGGAGGSGNSYTPPPTQTPTPPTITVIAPPSSLPATTVQSTLSLTTSKSAMCVYATTATTTFASATPFTSTGNLTHSTLIIGLQNGSAYTYYVQCKDSNGNTGTASVAFSVASNQPSPNTIPPSAPANLSINNISTSSMTLSWGISTSSIGIANYLIFRNSGTTAITQTNNLSFTDTGLTPATAYTYTVKSVDTAGIVSTSSNAVTTTTATIDATLPSVTITAPTGNLPAGTAQTTLSVTTNKAVSCAYSTSNTASYAAMTTFTTTGNTSHSTTLTGLINGSSYTYYVKCSDATGNISNNASVMFSVLPAVVSGSWVNTSFAAQTGSFTVNFDATPTQNLEDEVIGLSTNPAAAYTDLAAIVHFNNTGNIDARDGASYAFGVSIPYTAGQTYHFREVVNIPSHIYSVYVTSPGGTEKLLASNYNFRSEQSTVTSLANYAKFGSPGDATIANFTVANTPTPTATLSANPTTITAGQSSTLSWSSANTSSCTGTGFSASGISGSTAVTPAANTTYSVTCTGTGGSASASVAVTVTGGVVTPPSTPAGLTASPISSSQINLAWNLSTAGTNAIAGYKIYRNGTQVGTSAAANYSDTGLTASTAYTYTVAAYDTAGNVSAQSASASATTQVLQTAGQTCSSITQYGITWTFDTAYPCGQFVNGDYWVTPNTAGGTVRIVSMSPVASAGRSGWEVNPTNETQGFDSVAPQYVASLMPALPYNAAAGSSILKAISIPAGCDGGAVGKTCLSTAAVLTVLGSVPPNNGATVFRPPYFGTTKTLYSTAGINYASIPSFAPAGSIAANAPTLSAALFKIQKVQLDYISDWIGDQLHPSVNFQLDDPYGPGVSNNNAEAALRAMLQMSGDSTSDRQNVINALVQYGIDNYAALQGGVHWKSNGGHDQGMRLPIALAAFFLNDASMKSALANASTNSFAESDMTYFSPHNGAALWGQPSCSEQDYWNDITAISAKVCKDPYGYIDGGPTPNTAYQQCCTSKALKGNSLVVRLVPGLQSIWSYDASLAYADRWTSSGGRALPDPCAPLSSGGGPDPAHPGQCKLDPNLTPGSTFTSFSCQAGKQCGRFPSADGTGADNGLWYSPFVDAFWSAYRASAGTGTAGGGGGGTSSPVPPAVPTNLAATAASSLQINLTWTASAAGTNPVAGYKIFRNTTQVGTSASNSYSDTGLTAATAYSYTISAYDAAGNTSAQSGVANATTLASPPSVPTGLSATPASSGAINLSWTASTAGTNAIAGYKIYRNGTQVGTTTPNSFTDVGLSASTAYTYTVASYDTAGNTSVQSVSVSATTQTTTTGGGGTTGGGTTTGCTQATNFLARVSVDSAHQTAYTNLICGLVSNGIWSKLDVLYVFATQNSAAALNNLINTNFTATAVGTPTFTPNSGYTASGSDLINSNYNFSTNGVAYTQNTASIGGWSGTTAGSWGHQWFTSTLYNGNTYIGALDLGGPNAIVTINSSSQSQIPNNTDGSGLFTLVRPDGNTEILYRNGVSLGSVSQFSVALENGTLETAGTNIRAMFAGGALTSTDASNLYTLMRAYMQAVGATP